MIAAARRWLPELPVYLTPSQQRRNRHDQGDSEDAEDDARNARAKRGAGFLNSLRRHPRNQQRLIQRGRDDKPSICAPFVRAHRYGRQRWQGKLAFTGRYAAHAGRRCHHTFGGNDAHAVTARGIEDRFDVDQPQSQRAGRDEIRFRTDEPFDVDLRGHTAPRQRCSARTIGSNGEHARSAALQREIGAIEERARPGRIGRGRVEERGLARNRCGDVGECARDALDFFPDRAFDPR